MSRPHTCPNCQKWIPVDAAIFDAALNLICPSCENIALPTTRAGQVAVEAAIRARNQPPTYQPPYQTLPPYKLLPGAVPTPILDEATTGLAMTRVGRMHDL